MKKIVHSYKGIPTKELDKPISIRIGFDVHVVRPFKSEVTAKANKRIQQILQPFLRKNKMVRAQAEITGRNIVIPCSPLVGRL